MRRAFTRIGLHVGTVHRSGFDQLAIDPSCVVDAP